MREGHRGLIPICVSTPTVPEESRANSGARPCWAGRRGDFGSEAYQVKSLLEEIRVLRFRKAQDGMKVLIDNFSEEQAGIDVSDFSMMEMNLVREFLLGSLDKIHKLWWGKRGSGEGEGSGGGGTQEPGASAALAEEPEENGQERRRQLR